MNKKFENILHIKNMVCPRCVQSVEGILSQQGIAYQTVDLGYAELQTGISSEEEEKLLIELKKVGFELITEKHQQIVNQIKSLIIDEIYNTEIQSPQKLSVWLSEKLNRDYSQLSNIFTKVEGKNIQEFRDDVKIMRIKELLEYDELNISEIADMMDYNDAAYLSTRFKKATGLSPSQYKKQVIGKRGSLDSL